MFVKIWRSGTPWPWLDFMFYSWLWPDLGEHDVVVSAALHPGLVGDDAHGWPAQQLPVLGQQRPARVTLRVEKNKYISFTIHCKESCKMETGIWLLLGNSGKHWPCTAPCQTCPRRRCGCRQWCSSGHWSGRGSRDKLSPGRSGQRQ